ncbi:FAD:protein FMN transferase [Roseimaritima sediminicola]|uniref:FAD:protein FMN transferase n=1 Tax=Roseimaritima sediminicola TaxID=2662066 RepID=UPI0013867F99|nr:FAD:protein FMN transferase [Roseimaritima sediminicola]
MRPPSAEASSPRASSPRASSPRAASARAVLAAAGLGLLISLTGCGPPASEAPAPAGAPAAETPRDSAGGEAAAEPRGSGAADAAQPITVIEARGRTMGTTYSVKIASPPPTLPEAWQLQVDAELRRVNDQMSTYLKSSELSRFNRSQSTDWFEVSPETAEVVQYALEVSRLTEGAFDVTVAPLINAWSFGPEQRTNQPPSEATLQRLLDQVGYQSLEARLEPPALRKGKPELTVDLSAIAKGHGVDRVVDLLAGFGCEHLFVEIGGEVRVAGGRGDRDWGIGVQQPDGQSNQIMTALPLADGAVATSGDYRNFFEADGQRFSHTIDPRSGRPVQDPLASVSVMANNCMKADAWATAINVLGHREGLRVAREQQLDVMLIVREGDGYVSVKTGVFDG